MLNPQPELSDLPIKSYYRYALPAFKDSTGEPPPLSAQPSPHIANPGPNYLPDVMLIRV